MSIHNILNTTKHRPWEIPKTGWKFYQEWNNALFLHYKVEKEALKKFLPTALDIDLFEGQAWISVVAFTMEKIRPRYFPTFPPISNFNEINIRTYVRSKHTAGVYFLSIEGGRYWSCKLAKAIAELPYRYSKMKRTAHCYQAKNATYQDQLKITYKVEGKKLEKSALDLWLTERYALFQDVGTAINRFDIHHLEWPLQKLVLQESEIHYSRFNPLQLNTPNKAHYSKGVKVLAWGKQRL